MHPWQREMNRLRLMGVLLGVTVASVVARAIITGLTVLTALTAAVMFALLLGVLRLLQHGSRLGRSRDPRSGGTGR